MFFFHSKEEKLQIRDFTCRLLSPSSLLLLFGLCDLQPSSRACYHHAIAEWIKTYVHEFGDDVTVSSIPRLGKLKRNGNWISNN